MSRVWSLEGGFFWGVDIFLGFGEKWRKWFGVDLKWVGEGL